MIDVVYIDKDLLVCIKPAGVAVEGGKGESLTALLAAQVGGSVLPVHRLDQPVGGLLVAARTQAAAAALSRAVADRSFDKYYLAVIEGQMPCPAATLRHLLYHDARANKTYVVKKERRGVREAVLEYTVLDTDQTSSLVQIHLLTGRTHQIRAQFAGEQHPLVGDGRYGSRTKGTLRLWSAQVCFTHPMTGQQLQFTAPLPQGFWREDGTSL